MVSYKNGCLYIIRALAVKKIFKLISWFSTLHVATPAPAPSLNRGKCPWMISVLNGIVQDVNHCNTKKRIVHQLYPGRLQGPADQSESHLPTPGIAIPQFSIAILFTGIK
jgi:hypothetical protein